MSDVIRVLLSEGKPFRAVSLDSYSDWGTLPDWKAYCKQFATLFVDIDGVFALNENPHGRGDHNWQRLRPIEPNVQALLDGYKLGRYTLVFTTSRSEEHRRKLDQQIRALGFDDFRLLMGLPHSQRVLINDFAPTNPYPSAIAINLERNSDRLGDYL